MSKKSKALRMYLDTAKGLTCHLCGGQPVDLHHPREGQGMSQRASDWLVVPLCVYCHKGPHGVHGDRAMMYIKKTTELDMVADTIERVFEKLLGLP